jgi:hypothetical protein
MKTNLHEAFSLAPGFSPVARGAVILQAVSTALNTRRKPLKRFEVKRAGNHPAEAGC